MNRLPVLTAAAVGLLLVAAAPFQVAAQASDSTLAAAAGAAVARREPVTVYGVAAFFTAPLTAGGLVALAAGETVSPGLVMAPAVLGWFTFRAAHPEAGLRRGLRAQLAGESPAYRRVFTTSYAARLRQRRLKAIGIGSLAGIATAAIMYAAIERN